MPDREKVLRGLKCHADSTYLSCNSKECPYFDFDFCEQLLATEAIALLKEQDSVDHALEVLRANGWKEDRMYPDIIRCKDCKWYSSEISWCNNSMSPKEQTFFCADGDRR